MISSACEQVVNRAIKVHTVVTSKKRKVMFNNANGDETLDAKDIQQQVEDLKLYRDTKDNKEDKTSSSDSSSRTDA